MEDGYLDIGYCAGACRHSNSVSTSVHIQKLRSHNFQLEKKLSSVSAL